MMKRLEALQIIFSLAIALYQKILLEQLKAEDFDNIFEHGDAVSARKIAIENILNSYLNGNK